ncbi:SixA phosphatase family protein [Streptomyces albireticuli]|uniref:Phosphohistidine phosphatase n=1 Tax=Streptomyces albireticuli TaxID=1940 RepID=A0A2A2DDP2_9ACTN|nr:histidine phosphatase family protein [Streptomyces albireticuli]MCD9142364.1 histidine phosphatase family protein [Streptomyces albireticuli]MCD9162382.1 histidine phosphatase family protein [Streptomyces albireticuli]MCD9190538.1 histidine phosphatase family protein [Streptomyces albireticuli]PAU50608.1 phosphohistidine phosphatase [Streptomyces albireticuli]
MSAEPTRRIVLLRHAKAEWSDADDHERPLTDRGRKDAPVAGRWLAGSGIVPDLALCSTAVRTRETWKLAVPELPQRPRTVYEDRLYEASLGELIAVVNEVSDEVGDLLLIGHNPGMHALADALAGEAEADLLPRMNRSGFPTSAMAVLTFTGSWKSVEHGVGRLVAFWSPNA